MIQYLKELKESGQWCTVTHTSAEGTSTKTSGTVVDVSPDGSVRLRYLAGAYDLMIRTESVQEVRVINAAPKTDASAEDLLEGATADLTGADPGEES